MTRTMTRALQERCGWVSGTLLFPRAGEFSQAECSIQELCPKSREWLRGKPGVKSLGKRKSSTSSVQFLCSWEDKELAEGFEWGVLASLHLQPAVLQTSGTGLAAAGETSPQPGNIGECVLHPAFPKHLELQTGQP